MREFLVQLHVFEKDQKVQRDVSGRINRYLLDFSLLKKQVSAQNNYIKGLGGNGLEEATSIINEFVLDGGKGFT